MSLARNVALSTTLAALALNAAAAADSYQWEVSIGVQQSTVDSNPDTTTTTVPVAGEYHLAPVDLADHPWEEAAFLEHSTFVNAAIGPVKVKQDGAGGLDADGLMFNLGFTYATPEFPVRLSAQLTHVAVNDGDVDIKTTALELDAGYWIMPELIAGLRVTPSKTTISGAPDNKELDIAAYGKWVRSINDTLAFNAEAEIGQATYDSGNKDSDIVIGIAGDLYFNQRYGIGLALKTESGDADAAEGTTIGVRASAWFTENIGLRVGYEGFSASNAVGADSNTFDLTLVGRF